MRVRARMQVSHIPHTVNLKSFITRDLSSYLSREITDKFYNEVNVHTIPTGMVSHDLQEYSLELNVFTDAQLKDYIQKEQQVFKDQIIKRILSNV